MSIEPHNLQGIHKDLDKTIPKDGDALIYNATNKTWGPGQIVSRAEGPYGDSVIHVIASEGYVVNLKTHSGTPTARLPFDAIATYVYGGVKPYTYAIRIAAGAWSSSTNPSLALIPSLSQTFGTRFCV